VTWLIDRVTPLLRERFVDHDDAAVLQRLDAQADMLERLLADLMGEYAPDLANLRSVLATKLGEADPGTSQSDNADTNENVAVAEQRGSGTATADHRPSQVGRTPSGRATDSASPANALDTLAPPDPASDRAVKRVFTEAAAALRPGDPDNPLFYHMVRYAIWRGIEDLPNARADGRTYLSPLPPDRVAQYEKQLSAGHYADVINHVETSVARNPFWIDGHRFTVDALTALGHTAARDAVVYEVRAFLTRLPGLLDLSFNDGTPFASATTAQWLREYALGQDPASEPKRLASINGWREILQTAREDAREPGELLGNLERGLLTQSEPRARFLWGLALANACLEAGHPALAEAQLARLSDQYEALGLAAWEPSLGQDLETALATVREHTRARTGDPGPVAHNSVQASRPRSEHPSEI
jgi:type VI secretion system protein VasJ